MVQPTTLGMEQTRKTYARHGATGELFAVLHAELHELHRRRCTGQALAHVFWAIASHDARVLATMVANPAAITAPATDVPAAARRIGKVVVDHGQTACNTSGAIFYPPSGFAPQREHEPTQVNDQ